MTLIQKVKANLILEHEADDELLEMFIAAAVSYAESYQHVPENFYSDNPMPPTTEQAIICSLLIFMKVEMAVPVDFLLTMCKPVSKFGIRSIFFCDLIGIGRCRL